MNYREHEHDDLRPDVGREHLRAAAQHGLDLQAAGRRPQSCVDAAFAYLQRVGIALNDSDAREIENAIRGRGGARQRLLGDA